MEDRRPRLSSVNLGTWNDERAASSAAFAKTANCLHRSFTIFDDDRFRDFAQQRVERRFESGRGAHRLHRGHRVRNQFENRATHFFVLRFERCEQRAQRIDLVRRLRNRIARAGERFAQRVALCVQFIAQRNRIARVILRVDERLFRFEHARIPIVHRRQRGRAIFGGAALLIVELREIELALLDRDFDQMRLIARLGNLRDRAHERLARFGERLLVLAHFVGAFLSIALELIGDLAQTIALRTCRFELLRFLRKFCRRGAFLVTGAMLQWQEWKNLLGYWV